MELEPQVLASITSVSLLSWEGGIGCGCNNSLPFARDLRRGQEIGPIYFALAYLIAERFLFRRFVVDDDGFPPTLLLLTALGLIGCGAGHANLTSYILAPDSI